MLSTGGEWVRPDASAPHVSACLWFVYHTEVPLVATAARYKQWPRKAPLYDKQTKDMRTHVVHLPIWNSSARYDN